MNSQKIKNLIQEYNSLFWYTPEKEKQNIKEEFLVETILNYGDINAVKKLLKVLGIKKTAQIFYNSIQTSERRKGNYHELTINFFTLFFDRYAY